MTTHIDAQGAKDKSNFPWFEVCVSERQHVS